MPWKARSVMQERLAFIEAWLREEKPRSELCREYGISRKTGYKIVSRYLEEGEEGLASRSRRPHRCPMQTPAETEQRIIALRNEHPTWGPKKLLWSLEAQGLDPATLPAPSTVAGLLKRHGVVAPVKHRRHAFPSPPLVLAAAPNDVWATDFKGWFVVGSGQRCDPLTVLDSWSRCLLACRGYYAGFTLEGVQEVFRALFTEHGLPRYMLSDNGTPFAAASAGGLTRLSAWWVRLGITPLRIVPGKPQHNGRLERFHRTLKSETARPPASTPTLQDERFAAFRHEYNGVRPHEALGGATPALRFAKSPRPYLGDPAPLDYPEGIAVRAVDQNGNLYWKQRRIYLSKALARESVGLRLHEREPLATVLLGKHPVCLLNLESGRMAPFPRQLQMLAVEPADPHQGTTTRMTVTPMSIG
jgi:putative transposase